MESIGIPLQQQVRCSHNTDGNTLKTNFVFLALGTSLSTMHIYTTWFSIRFILSFFQSHSV